MLGPISSSVWVRLKLNLQATPRKTESLNAWSDSFPHPGEKLGCDVFNLFVLSNLEGGAVVNNFMVDQSAVSA